MSTAKVYLLVFILVLISLVHSRVYDVQIRTDDTSNAGTTDTIWIQIRGDTGLWSEAVDFEGSFNSKDTTYDLTTYAQWDVKDVGTGEFVRITSYGTNGFQLREVILDGVGVSKNYDALRNSVADGRCDRITVDIADDSYDFEALLAGNCPVSSSPTLYPTLSPTIKPTDPTVEPTNVPTALTDSPTKAPTAAPTTLEQYPHDFKMDVVIYGLSQNDYNWLRYASSIIQVQYTIENVYLEIQYDDQNHTRADEIYVEVYKLDNIDSEDFLDDGVIITTATPETGRRLLQDSSKGIEAQLYTEVFCATKQMCRELYTLTFGRNTSTYFETYLLQALSEFFEGYSNTTITLETKKNSSSNNKFSSALLAVIIVCCFLCIFVVVMIFGFYWCRHQYGVDIDNWPCLGKKDIYSVDQNKEMVRVENEAVSPSNDYIAQPDPGQENKSVYKM